MMICGSKCKFVFFQICVFSILNKAWIQAESATPPSVTTGAPKWAKAPFYSDLVPSGSRQFASRFRPRNQKVRNLCIIS